MVKRLIQQDRLEQILDQYAPLVEQAFFEAIEDIRSSVVLERVIELLEKGDVISAANAVGITPVSFNPLALTGQQAYSSAGQATVLSLPNIIGFDGHRIVLRFDFRSLAVEYWLKSHFDTLITNIVTDQYEAIREKISLGLQQGQNPRVIASDIVGRVNKITKQRSGGIIGLTAQQANFVEAAREELSSGNPALLKNYLKRTRRDKRFDRTIEKAIREENIIDAALVTKIVGRYADSLLQLRGETIARTETMEAINAAQMEAGNQIEEQTGYSDQDIERVWKTAKDARVRDSHAAMNGQVVKGMDTPFVTPSGYQLKYPGDSSLGAPAKETIQCRCIQVIRLNYMKGVI